MAGEQVSVGRGLPSCWTFNLRAEKFLSICLITSLLSEKCVCVWWIFLYLYTHMYLHACVPGIFSSVAQVVSNSVWPHEPQHTRPPCRSPTPRVYSNSCPLSWWCHPAISSSVVPFSSCPQFFLASGSFPVSQFFASSGQSIEVSASASVLSVII